ncbi:hypothetical protein SAMN05444274_102496 [Mariniphaga anaerophila]|uniref:Uncharacterized protein n=1 Tax=Mariniphaga anaerophila TaxID=1484053 RepID=A0A1M4WMQ3_9BACT|nr:hypothetical protein SAMN05444274_102496 [Mariniphaga anaerophila]
MKLRCSFMPGIKNIFNQKQKDYDKGEYCNAAYISGPLPIFVFATKSTVQAQLSNLTF